jgi:hypothetical protein
METSELEKFNAKLNQSPEAQQMPDEIALSLPVPTGKDQVVVLAFYMRGRPPVPPGVGIPKYRLTVDYPSGKVTRVERLTSSLPSGITPGKDGVLGHIEVPPEFQNMPYDKYRTLEQEFNHLYSAAIEAYRAERPMDQARCMRLKELLQIFGKPPLFPLLAESNPAFFRMLECK